MEVEIKISPKSLSTKLFIEVYLQSRLFTISRQKGLDKKVSKC